LSEARRITNQFFMEHKKTSTNTQHKVTSIGNCHIDTAWLWTYDETKRKIVRSFTTQMHHMDLYPDYRFTASQAQQFEWTEHLYPEVFERIKANVEKGQFIPIGTYIFF
jgi:alpha-mannosidase